MLAELSTLPGAKARYKSPRGCDIPNQFHLKVYHRDYLPDLEDCLTSASGDFRA